MKTALLCTLMFFNLLAYSQVGETCSILLTKIQSNQEKGKTYQLGKKLKARHSDKKESSTESSMILLSSGRSGTIIVDETELTVTCYKRQMNYEIEIDLKGSKTGISTSLVMNRGSRVNIGEIAKDLVNQDQNVSINAGIEKSNSQKESKTHYYLEIK